MTTPAGQRGTAAAATGLGRVQAAALAAALVGLTLCGLGAAQDLKAFLRAYLIAELVWAAVPVGCLALLLAYHIMDGRWGIALGGALAAAARTLPLVALLFVPVLFFLHDLFPWAREEFLQRHHVVQKKTAYLNEPFFIARSVLYWAVWAALAFALTAPRGRFMRKPRRVGLATAGAILWAVTASFAAIDWLMSLHPTFYSSAFGMYVMSIQALMGFALAVPATIAVTEPRRRESLLREEQLVGLGSILLSLVMLWAYFAYMQFLVIWSGNIPHHAEWYVVRGASPWAAVFWAIAVAGGAVPLATLLSTGARRSWRVVGALCLLVLAAHALEIVWIAAPGYYHEHEQGPPAWLVAAAFVAIGGLWLAAFARQLTARPADVAADVEEASRG